MSRRAVYFDYAATTPPDRRVTQAMRPYLTGQAFGNPGSLHSFGQAALAAVDAAREKLATLFNAQFREIIFTGSATEANNLALRGTVCALTQNANTGNGNGNLNFTPRIITSAIEHESVLATARDLERTGVEVVYLPVDTRGMVSLTALQKNLNERTALISIMYVNNETGAVQPLPEIAKIIAEFKIHLPPTTHCLPLFHTDAAQAGQLSPCRPAELGVDMLTLSAHKMYGPKGVGALYVEQKLENRNYKLVRTGNPPPDTLQPIPYLHPILTGGGQEWNYRSGTENVAGIIGLVTAAELCLARQARETKRLSALKKSFWLKLHKFYPAAVLNGPEISAGAPHILNVSFPGRLAEELLLRLDMAGYAVSSGSACAVRSNQPSHVLLAMGLSPTQAKESLRFSFGAPTTTTEVNTLLSALRHIL